MEDRCGCGGGGRGWGGDGARFGARQTIRAVIPIGIFSVYIDRSAYVCLYGAAEHKQRTNQVVTRGA